MFALNSNRFSFIFLQDILNLFKGKKRFIVIGHSFGAIVAIELAKMLEANGLTGRVVCIDGSISLFKRYLKKVMPNMEATNENILNFLVVQMAFEILPHTQPAVIQKILNEEKTWEDRINKYVSLMPKQEYSHEYFKNICCGVHHRIKLVLKSDDNYKGDKIKSNITLIRPSASVDVDIDNDYQLSQYTNGSVAVTFIDGNHLSILDNIQLYQIINDICLNKTSN